MKKTSDVTVILTVWKRNHLEEQIQAMLRQTVPAANIWVQQYGNHVATADILARYPGISYVHSDLNLKYFGRFSLALHATSRYTWVLDDDIIPADNWVEKCISTCEQYNAIVCSNGRLIPPGDYTPEVSSDASYRMKYFIGDSPLLNGFNVCPADTIIDFGCSSYFLRSAWLRHFWAIWPYTFDTGEDMHLSATAKLLGNVRTVVPAQTSPEDTGNRKPAYSCDEHASYKKQGFIQQRTRILKYLIDEKHWSPTLWAHALAGGS